MTTGAGAGQGDLVSVSLGQFCGAQGAESNSASRPLRSVAVRLIARQWRCGRRRVQLHLHSMEKAQPLVGSSQLYASSYAILCCPYVKTLTPKRNALVDLGDAFKGIGCAQPFGSPIQCSADRCWRACPIDYHSRPTISGSGSDHRPGDLPFRHELCRLDQRPQISVRRGREPGRHPYQDG